MVLTLSTQMCSMCQFNLISARIQTAQTQSGAVTKDLIKNELEKRQLDFKMFLQKITVSSHPQISVCLHALK